MDIADIPMAIVVHAEVDRLCSYKEANIIVECINQTGGCSELKIVPEDMANADGQGRNKKKTATATADTRC